MLLDDAGGVAKVADFGTVKGACAEAEGDSASDRDGEQLDCRSFGLVVVELLSGQPPQSVSAKLLQNPRFVKEYMQQLDMAAGSWSKPVAKGLVGVAQQCHQPWPAECATVRSVLPKLSALHQQVHTGPAARGQFNSGRSGGHLPPSAVAGQVRQRLAQQAQYDEATAMPANVAAKKLIVLDWNSGAASSVVNLPFTELEQATHGFDEFNELGKGASCFVYKGHCFGQAVAVKKLNEGASEWGARQFEAEMKMLTTVTHANICRLLAFSTDGPCRCLVMEFCAGGALDDRLACRAPDGHVQPAPLQWQRRVQIAYQIALALEHLHSMSPPLIHR